MAKENDMFGTFFSDGLFICGCSTNAWTSSIFFAKTATQNNKENPDDDQFHDSYCIFFIFNDTSHFCFGSVWIQALLVG
jgi:hypothetical protein